MALDVLRSCSGCSAHILTAGDDSEHAWCTKCRCKHVMPFATWSASLDKGSQVYIQPYIDPAFARSTWLVRERCGDAVSISVLGIPDRIVRTTIQQLAEYPMTKRVA